MERTLLASLGNKFQRTWGHHFHKLDGAEEGEMQCGVLCTLCIEKEGIARKSFWIFPLKAGHRYLLQ